MTNERKAAFLAGEGTITLHEAREWSRDLAPDRGMFLPPAGMPMTEPLMVSVVNAR